MYIFIIIIYFFKGYKVFWSNGPQIKPPHDKHILESIGDHIVPKDQLAFSEDLSAFKDLITDPTEEMSDLYYNVLRDQLYDADKLNSNFKKKIIYTVITSH